MSTLLLFDALVATSICSLLVLIWYFVVTRTSRASIQRVHEVVNRGADFGRQHAGGSELSRKILQGVRWIRGVAGIGDSEKLPGRLTNAGYRGTYAADVYNAARVLMPIGALASGMLIPWYRSFWVIALPAVGFIAPNIIVTRLIRRRRERIRRSIPDTIDLLVICVDAGLGIDQALLRVGQELGFSHPEITEELLQINREQRAGKPRIQAWADMAQRSNLTDIDAFASMLLQTERFGTPIARALSGFADGIRLKRRQLAEQMAAKTTVKIVFPLVLFIFPSLFVVLLAPAMIGIVRGMTAAAAQ